MNKDTKSRKFSRFSSFFKYLALLLISIGISCYANETLAAERAISFTIPLSTGPVSVNAKIMNDEYYYGPQDPWRVVDLRFEISGNNIAGANIGYEINGIAEELGDYCGSRNPCSYWNSSIGHSKESGDHVVKITHAPKDNGETVSVIPYKVFTEGSSSTPTPTPTPTPQTTPSVSPYTITYQGVTYNVTADGSISGGGITGAIDFATGNLTINGASSGNITDLMGATFSQQLDNGSSVAVTIDGNTYDYYAAMFSSGVNYAQAYSSGNTAGMQAAVDSANAYVNQSTGGTQSEIAITGTSGGTYNYGYDGATNATITLKVDGKCMFPKGKIFPLGYAPVNYSPLLCTTGTLMVANGVGRMSWTEGSYYWECWGENGGYKDDCEYSFKATGYDAVPERPACGSDFGKTLSSPPGSNACISGTIDGLTESVSSGTKTVFGGGIMPAGEVYEWNCRGLENASNPLYRNRAVQYGCYALRSGSGGTDTDTGAGTGVGIGTGAETTGNGNYTTENITPCGSASGITLSSMPTTNLCIPGSTALNIQEGENVFLWDCSRSTGGFNGCRAYKITREEHGVCGSLNEKKLPLGYGPYTSGNSYCTAGDISVTSSPDKWVEGSTYRWSCKGTDNEYVPCSYSYSSSYDQDSQRPACGPSDKSTFSETPQSGLCSSGIAQNISSMAASNTIPRVEARGSGEIYKWDCKGYENAPNITNRGTQNFCYATKGVSVTSADSPTSSTTSSRQEISIPVNTPNGKLTWIVSMDKSKFLEGEDVTYYATIAQAEDRNYRATLKAYIDEVREVKRLEDTTKSLTTQAGRAIHTLRDFNFNTGIHKLIFVHDPKDDGTTTTDLSFEVVRTLEPFIPNPISPTTSDTTRNSSLASSQICGSSNNQTFSTKPTANLCVAGSNSSEVEERDAAWSWTCSGGAPGSVKLCRANKGTVSGGSSPQPTGAVCGSQAGEVLSSAPTNGFCQAGTMSNFKKAFLGRGWVWRCSDGFRDTYCYAYPELSPPRIFETSRIDAQCGSAAGQTTSQKPNSSLCTSGRLTKVIEADGKWKWVCRGSARGSNVSCEANKGS